MILEPAVTHQSSLCVNVVSSPSARIPATALHGPRSPGGPGSIYLAVRVGTTVITSQWRTFEGAPRYQSELASVSSVMESRARPHEEKHD
jgi:hypothetical protein